MDVLHRTLGVPMLFVKELKTRAEMIAPTLPHAADMPWAVPLNLVGKTSAG